MERGYHGRERKNNRADKSRQHSMHQWGACDTVRPDGVPVKALTEEMLQDIVASYGKTAALAKRAGFQMIMAILDEDHIDYLKNKRADAPYWITIGK